jgi:subtilisin-like proprotein convertase family protein
MSSVRRRSSFLPVATLVAFVVGLFVVFAAVALRTPKVEAAGSYVHGTSAGQQLTVFSNPAPIVPADRVSNNAGTNPGIPPSNYPSPIVVSGLTGTVSKVTVTFAITGTFPDDLDVLLVGPTGARSLVISDAGGSGDPSSVTYTFDQTAATAFPDGPTTAVPAGTYRPANYTGLATPEPGGQDNFPTPGPGLMSYPTDFNVFNGTAPNGTWNLYVVDDQVIDNNSLPSGWSIDITTSGGGGASDAAVDFNGDGSSDYVVVRNTGGGAGGQITWYISPSSGGPVQSYLWGLSTDFFLAEDFDGDTKDDIAVWRPGAAGTAAFYILNSSNFTARVEAFGQTGDDPTVVGDYNGDNKADLAVYRSGASAGAPSFWYYRTTANGPVSVVQWGVNGDVPAPGDYDGNASNDFCVQRPTGGGNAAFWLALNGPGTVSVTGFGFSNDLVVPGDYDGDGKTDIATARAVSGQIIWYWLASSTGTLQGGGFGLVGPDTLTPGDYDGDGKTDLAVWRDGTFWVRRSQTGSVSTFQFGLPGDYPVANFNTH